MAIYGDIVVTENGTITVLLAELPGNKLWQLDAKMTLTLRTREKPKLNGIFVKTRHDCCFSKFYTCVKLGLIFFCECKLCVGGGCMISVCSTVVLWQLGLTPKYGLL